MTDEAVSYTWQKHKRWSAVAGLVKKQLDRWRTVVFALGIAGAFLETLATQVPSGAPRQVCAWVGAATLLIIPIVSLRKLTPAVNRAWVRARSASEGLKAEVYTYLSRAAPYDDPTSAADTLKEKGREIENSVNDLLSYEALATAKSSDPPGPLAPPDYLRKRVRNQIDWYRPKAALYARKAGRLRNVELVLSLAAAALSAAAAVWGESLALLGGEFLIGAWVAVLTTIGGAITAHIGASRYDYLVTSYLGTACRLEDLASRWPPTGGGTVPSPEWSAFVQSCENAISTENQGWMAKWVKTES
ncbi:DUF4231 domain-containing protein [Candidatus Eisenbacteria bacterium]|uniref:DUF4231 domain-containing protein n=1 Tax=Eiseniibacteriota bacterium TaxID=2212470 RepID=A0ABV6YKD4_UNCEI